jgi:hypothetical protein
MPFKEDFNEFFEATKVGWFFVFVIIALAAIVAIILASLNTVELNGNINDSNIEPHGIGPLSLTPAVLERLLNQRGTTIKYPSNGLGTQYVRVAGNLGSPYQNTNYRLVFESSEQVFDDVNVIERTVTSFLADVANLRVDNQINVNIAVPTGTSLVPFTFDTNTSLQQGVDGELQIVTLYFGLNGGQPPTKLMIVEPKTDNAVLGQIVAGQDLVDFTFPTPATPGEMINSLQSFATIAFDYFSDNIVGSTDMSAALLLTLVNGDQEVTIVRVDAGDPTIQYSNTVKITADIALPRDIVEMIRIGDFDLVVSQTSQNAVGSTIQPKLRYILTDINNAVDSETDVLTTVPSLMVAPRQLFSVARFNTNTALMVMPNADMNTAALLMKPTFYTLICTSNGASNPPTLTQTEAKEYTIEDMLPNNAEYGGFIYQCEFVTKQNNANSNELEMVIIWLKPLGASYSFVLVLYSLDVTSGGPDWVFKRKTFLYQSTGTFTTDFRCRYVMHDDTPIIQISGRRTGNTVMVNPAVVTQILPRFNTPTINHNVGALTDVGNGEITENYGTMVVKNSADNTNRLVTVRDDLILAVSNANEFIWTSVQRVLD